METIIVSNLKNITMSSKIVIFGKDEVKIDIAKLFQGEEAYIEITQISKVYGKRFNNWSRLDEVQEYIKKLEEYLNSSKMSMLENGVKSTKTRATKVKSPLIIRRAGRYNSGTWLHRKLALKYFRWLDVEFEIAIDMFLERVYKQVDVVKINRRDTKTLFYPLTDSIRDIYIPAQSSENAKRWAYPTLLDMINLKVLGMRARDFREKNNIPKGKDIYTRDYMGEEQLKSIKRFQSHLNTMLEMGITDYNQLKEFIENISL